MKKLILGLVFIGLVLGFSGCDNENKAPEKPPVKIEAKVNVADMGSYVIKTPTVYVTALSNVEIQDLIVNEGNGCQIRNGISSGAPVLPSSMKYGDKRTWSYQASCNILKVQVVTNKGTWTVEY